LHRIEFRTFDGIACSGVGCCCRTIPRDGAQGSRGVRYVGYIMRIYDPFAAGLAVCYHNTTSCHPPTARVVIVAAAVALVGGRRYAYYTCLHIIYFSLYARARRWVWPPKSFSTRKRCLGIFVVVVVVVVVFLSSYHALLPRGVGFYFNLLRVVAYTIYKRWILWYNYIGTDDAHV